MPLVFGQQKIFLAYQKGVAGKVSVNILVFLLCLFSQLNGPERMLMAGKTFLKSILPLVLLTSLAIARPALGTVILTESGTSSAGVPVSFEADLTIAGNTLTLALINTSPVSSLNPADTLGSFYFDIVNGSNVRPTLTYASASGDVYLGDKDNPDSLQTAGANLRASLPEIILGNSRS